MRGKLCGSCCKLCPVCSGDMKGEITRNVDFMVHARCNGGKCLICEKKSGYNNASRIHKTCYDEFYHKQNNNERYCFKCNEP